MGSAQPVYQPLIPEDSARGDLYAILARLFAAAPDAGFLDGLARAGDLPTEDRESPLPQAWSRLCKAAGGASPEVIAEEFGDLFLGIGKPKVVPFASYHLAGFMNEKPLAELRADIAALGLGRAEGVCETEDHFAALADVMRHLITDPSLPADVRDELQQRVFRRHLQPWYGAFCDALEAAENARFYSHAARFARAFLDLESESFEIES